MSSISYTGKIPWPSLTKEQKQVVDSNYENLLKSIAEEDDPDFLDDWVRDEYGG